MLTEEMKKSIDEIVENALNQQTEVSEESVESVEKMVEASTQELSDPTAQVKEVEKSEVSEEETSEEIEKGVKSGEAPKEKTPENGGKDEVKSGTPKTEKQKMMKSEDEDEDDEKEETPAEEKKEESKKKLKKSVEELSEYLDADELELIAAWRADQDEVEEPVAKSQSGLSDTPNLEEIVKSAVASASEEFKKSLDAKDAVIKSLSDKVEKMASQPAYDRRSVESLEVIEKSGESDQPMTKAQVLDTMLDLQKSGKGITSYHIAQVEGLGSVSGLKPEIKQMILDAYKTK
jgi:hypothetical protein